MLVADFNEEFTRYIHNEDLQSAGDSILRELARILVRDKSDFIDMLIESGVEADSSMSDSQLIELFVDNAHNKRMLLAASLLVNSHNKKMGFDGEDEISDDGVKLGYAVLNETFNGDIEDDEAENEDFSYIVPLVAAAVKKGVKNLRKNRQANGGSKSVTDSQAIAKMQEQLIAERQLRLDAERKRVEEEAKNRKLKNALIIGGTIGLAALIGAFVYIKNRK